MGGGILNNARRQKADEFYTQLSDIEKELKHYKCTAYAELAVFQASI